MPLLVKPQLKSYIQMLTIRRIIWDLLLGKTLRMADIKKRCFCCKKLSFSRRNTRLERTVSGYFDYIEDLIERENTFTMEEFVNSVNAFLAFASMIFCTTKEGFQTRQLLTKLMKNLIYTIRIRNLFDLIKEIKLK